MSDLFTPFLFVVELLLLAPFFFLRNGDDDDIFLLALLLLFLVAPFFKSSLEGGDEEEVPLTTSNGDSCMYSGVNCSNTFVIRPPLDRANVDVSTVDGESIIIVVCIAIAVEVAVDYNLVDEVFLRCCLCFVEVTIFFFVRDAATIVSFAADEAARVVV